MYQALFLDFILFLIYVFDACHIFNLQISNAITIDLRQSSALHFEPRVSKIYLNTSVHLVSEHV